MNRVALVVVIAACLALAAVPAAAQDALSKRVSLDLKGMAPADAFRVIGSSIGMTITVDPKVTAPIDILVRGVTAKTALTTVCESIGCRWSVSDKVISVTPLADTSTSASVKFGDAKSEKARAVMDRVQASLKQTLPAGMKFENAPLADVNARLSAALNLKVELISEDATLQTLTADFSNQTLLQALKSVFPPGDRAYSWRIGISDRGSGDKSPTIMLGIKVDPKKK